MLPEPRAGRSSRAGGGRVAGMDETARGWHRPESEPQGWEDQGSESKQEIWKNKSGRTLPRPQTVARSDPKPGWGWHSLGAQPAGLGWAGLAGRMAQAVAEADGGRRGPDPQPTRE